MHHKRNFSGSFLAALLLCPLVPFASQTGAQEPVEDADDSEFGERLRELAEQRQRLAAQTEFYEERKLSSAKRLEKVKLLESLHRQIPGMIKELEQAEKAEDEKSYIQLAEKIEQQEVKIEGAQTELEIATTKHEISIQLFEFESDGDSESAKELAKLLPVLAAQEARVKKAFQAFRRGDDEEAEGLFEEIEATWHLIEVRQEIVELNLEMRHARDEGEDDIVVELDEELENLRREAAELSGEPMPNPEKDATPRKPRPEKDAAKMLPIRIDEQSVATAKKLELQKDIAPMLRLFCMDCHDSTAAGDLDIEKLVNQNPLVKNREAWLNILEQIRNRSMPPTDVDATPTDQQRQSLASWLQHSINDFDYKSVSQPGYEPVRRLTHHQYNNALRDLLGVDLRPASEFPDDMIASSGFANSANSLFLHPLLLERYLGAAESAIESALPAKPTTPQHKTSHRLVFQNVDDKSSQNRAAKMISRFARRAWRRPITDAEQRTLSKIFQQSSDDGQPFDEAVKDVLKVVLVSPNFLLHAEQSQSTDLPWQVKPWELGNRLAFFLWGSIPDDELNQLADSKRLFDQNVLLEQVDRMLSDERANSMGNQFASQWLGYQHLGTRIRADPIDNPWCTDSLMDAMKSESSMFFVSLIREDKPISSLLDARYTFVNQELADFYRIPNVSGDRMRRVSFGAKDPRGGLLGHGSILAVTSFPGRTSPVVRGRWILSDLLGTPPPPPPPNVSELSESVARRNLSMRQKLEVHRDNPNCYACHSQIDPLGFGLENFDWFGRWKTTSRGKPIDASGKLPDGNTFIGPQELRKVLVATRLDDLTEQLTRKMLSYALGRQLEYFDEAEVRSIAKKVKEDGYRIRTLVNQIVLSFPFQFKQHPTRN